MSWNSSWDFFLIEREGETNDYMEKSNGQRHVAAVLGKKRTRPGFGSLLSLSRSRRTPPTIWPAPFARPCANRSRAPRSHMRFKLIRENASDPVREAAVLNQAKG